MTDTILYPERDAAELCDYYLRHVEHMTSEGLFGKGDIAAQLAWRDREIDRLSQQLAATIAERDDMQARYETASEIIQSQATDWAKCEAERDRAVKDAGLARAVERAAEVLPEGWSISVEAERHAGAVYLYDDEGDAVEFEDTDRTLAAQVDAAIDAAIAAAAGDAGEMK